jgi:hypothetical protein
MERATRSGRFEAADPPVRDYCACPQFTADSLRVNLNPAAGSTKLDLLVEESDNPDELEERLSEYEAMEALLLSCHGHNA